VNIIPVPLSVIFPKHEDSKPYKLYRKNEPYTSPQI
jgi:hypothetical protein